MYRNARYTEVEENLLYFKKRYEGILKERPAPWEVDPEGSEYESARQAYYNYIEEQLADVNEKLGLIEHMR